MKPIEREKIFIERHFNDSVEAGKVDAEKVLFLDQLTGDASTRRYYRLVTQNKSYVVCLDNPFESAEKYPFLVVQKFLKENDINVPEVYDFVSESGYLLEGDLGDTTLLKFLADKSIEDELEIFKSCIDILCKIQTIPNAKIPALSKSLRFDHEKLYGEIEFCFKYFFEYLGLSDSTKYIREKEILKTEFSKICEYLESEIKTLCHRDYHSRNLMVLGSDNPQPIVIDFQDARMGSYTYDLVSLLEDCYYQIESENLEKLKKYYFDCMNKKVKDFYTYEEFKRLYNLSLIQRVFKAIGSFSYIYQTRKDVRYLKYIGFALEKLKLVLNSDPKFQSLKTALFKIYYEN